MSQPERTIEQWQADFVHVIEKLRCYGDHCPFPACCKTPETQSLQPMALRVPEVNWRDADVASRLHRACVTLRMPPRAEEFAEYLFRQFFMPISWPRTFGVSPNPGIAASIRLSCSEYKLPITEDKICTVFRSVNMERLEIALDQIERDYVKLRNRYFKGKLRARGEARGAVYDHAARRRRRLCGRDVTRELRAQIYLMSEGM
ncbi:uncharacterized protein Z520_04824 [Fonsecaea multimorphosa CBS 102226]|uniref:Uncharacterized protein n=1 Tax=Fonsecaea multimorphosa CBS 102226 TaxID=1442371 RepID=A0A0D2KRA4_9EURO|nr:uncharacterized protein Z520_04824 [Fonsecaea multimorphosa CBS 102226]KIX99248.1 hypothetical protein Z520_04824 [Fonsecaea multimorphosa CBS 102226]OAL25940.1 hypothetical protein AYO22_04567 [Fonsecaea multimorphosa]